MDAVHLDVRQPIPDGESWSDDAIDGLVGQRVTLAGFAIEGTQFGTIVKAWREDKSVVMRIEPDAPDHAP